MSSVTSRRRRHLSRLAPLAVPVLALAVGCGSSGGTTSTSASTLPASQSAVYPVTVQGGWVTTRGRVRITWLENIAVTDASNQNFPIQ